MKLHAFDGHILVTNRDLLFKLSRFAVAQVECDPERRFLESRLSEYL